MAGNQVSKGSSAKVGRNKDKTKRYLVQGRLAKNKIRKLDRHTALYPNDHVARESLTRTKKVVAGDRIHRNV